jgi:type IV pilus assembly protein PilN
VIRINLLPVREARRKAGVQQQIVMLAATLVTAIVLSTGVHQWVRGSISSTKERIHALETQLEQYKPQEQQVTEFKAKKAEIEQKLSVIANLERSRSGPVRLMEDLASSIPDRVWLTDLAADKGRISLSGMSLDNELVASFLTKLGESPYFGQVELQSTELKVVESLKLNTFKIQAALESPGEPADGAAAPASTPAPKRPGRRPAADL